MANPKSLKPFRKGHDPRRNTRGRPVATWDPWKKAIEKELKEKIVTKYGHITKEKAIVMNLVERAHAGHLPSARIVLGYSLGKPISFCPRCDYRATKQAREEFRKEKARDEKAEREAAEKEVASWIAEWEENKK